MDADRLVGRGSPFELVDGEFRHRPRSLSAWYARARAAPSQSLVAGEKASTYAEVFGRAHALARRLAGEFGVGPGERIAICSGNGAEWLEAFVAVTRLGAAAVLIHADAPDSEVARARDVVGCRFILADGASRARLQATGLQVIGIDESTASRETPASDYPDVEPDSVAVIAPTSGSTRASKWVLLSHRALLSGAMNTLLASAMASQRNRSARAASAGVPVSLLLSPLTHVSGYMHFLTMLHVGGTLVTTPRRDARGIAELVARHAVSSLVGAPPELVRELVRDPVLVALSGSLRSLGVQGVHLSQSLLAEINARLPQVTVGSGYGLTETNGLVSLALGTELAERPQTCGRVVPSVGVRIADGEIWLRGPMLAQGYAGDLEADAAAFRDGWFRTGDLGHIDPAGFLHVVGRADRARIRTDSRAVCATLERLALDAEFVDEAVALELEEPAATRAIVAVVRRRGSCFALEDLRRLVREEAGDAACVMEVAALPRTSSGKVDRAALRTAISSRLT